MTETSAEPARAPAGDALGRALAAEHAAVYAYGVIGGRTSGALLRRATAGFDAHRARRDQLRALITQRGGTPAEPGPTYSLPFAVRKPADAVRLAVLVEQRVTTAYLELAADRDPALRRIAALAAQECATRAYGWQPKIGDPFPGMNRGGADFDAAVPAPEAETPAPDSSASDGSSGTSGSEEAQPEPSAPEGQ
ncbi:ferritin-like domain-containing protein [Microbispora sp. GKU 823]|uniref:ferritin-like domain-containing protein n=1 Tax=Microbispora sp. GKU 823 TaxID=1652100 RepID=UPI00117D20F7|nr:ferritin-like domain-containing protein [Microbispora sp. GKU 823]